MKRAAVLTGLGLLGICAGIVAQNQPPAAPPAEKAAAGSSMPEPNPSAPKAAPMKPTTASALKQLQDLWHASRTPEDFRSVGHGFEALLKSDPTNAEIRVRYADLLAERFNAADAEALYLEALKLDSNNADAYIGLAELYADGFDEHSAQAAKAALEIDPKRFHADEILGRMALEDSNYAKAAEMADAALKINPEAVEAIAIHATIELLNDKPADAWISKIGNRGEGYADIAKELVINRRYEDGIAFYRKAIAANPQLWSAHSQLGVNLMRLGRNEEAHTELDLAYSNGYADAATSNTLQLMETYKNYQTFTWPSASPDGPQPAGILKLDQKEAAALRPYFEAEMKKAMATYEKKYGYKMTKPVQVEVYRRENDFGVRVMGLPGVGLLGVTFNTVVAMDGPSSRSKQEGYHWASVLWHELSHVYTIAMTNERIPRWFTEGVAVHEESATTPDWGDRLNPTILAAIRDKKLLPIADMDRGFVHPTYPDQVIVSYFQAGMICDYIVKRWGDPKLVDIIHAFAKTQSTVDVIREQLKIEPEQFDKDFLADLETRTGKAVAGFSEWTKELRELNTAVKDDKIPADFVERARKLETIYPEYVETGNPYVLAGDALLKAGDKAGAMAEYAKYSKIGGRNLETMEKYADLLAASGDKKAAVAALWRMIYCFPLDAGLHEKLGNLDLETAANADAVREFQVLVDLSPDDKAGSHYNLARAFKANGQTDKAREEAITALEAAPEYRPAQKLLLEVSGEDGKTP
ncbi:MAG TPA: tetratricopeptide repeat protein [Bryobacteraceae bacterium]